MAVVQIPTRSDLDDWSLAVDLNGVGFGLRFVWNTRDSRWMMDIRDSAGAVLLTGIPVVVNQPLTLPHVGTDLPDGLLLAMDTSGEYREIIEKTDLGDRVKLVFVPSSDY